ncbi:MAG: dual specificity protein phosphatase family protein [Anaerolineae bacterium]|nr:dual specificity protein phosphatase family protein [Anaerolineae bacterium]
MTPPYNFQSASPDDRLIFGSERPCYRASQISLNHALPWLQFMREEQKIQRVVCLLDGELTYYQPDLLSYYRMHFGPDNVCHSPVKDNSLIDRMLLVSTILPFLEASAARSQRTVVHCSAGMGRTGQVLAAWLVRHYGLAPDEALDTVSWRGRNPREAVQWGHASNQQLVELLEACRP